MFRWAWSKTGSLIERVQKWIPCFTKFMFDLLLFFCHNMFDLQCMFFVAETELSDVGKRAFTTEASIQPHVRNYAIT